MLARDIMTLEPAVVTATDTVPVAAQLMRTRDVGMLPVVDDLVHRRLVGVLTDRDIVLRYVAPEHGRLASVRDHMTREPMVTATATSTIAEVVARMSRHQVRRLPVVDANDAVIGVIAQADIALKVRPHDADLVDHLTEAISRPGALVH
ncbi:MAG: CBS domain-containing protein [Gemmatimonadaceae bacterium]